MAVEKYRCHSPTVILSTVRGDKSNELTSEVFQVNRMKLSWSYLFALLD